MAGARKWFRKALSGTRTLGTVVPRHPHSAKRRLGEPDPAVPGDVLPRLALEPVDHPAKRGLLDGQPLLEVADASVERIGAMGGRGDLRLLVCPPDQAHGSSVGWPALRPRPSAVADPQTMTPFTPTLTTIARTDVAPKSAGRR